MVYIRQKAVSGKRYYQVVQSYRDEEGRPRQEVLCHLGVHSSIEEAIEHEKRSITARLREANKLRNMDHLMKEAHKNSGGQALSKAYIAGRQREWQQEKSQDGSLYEAHYERWKRYMKRYSPEWSPRVDWHYQQLICMLIPWEEARAKKHQAKLKKLLEIKQKYF